MGEKSKLSKLSTVIDTFAMGHKIDQQTDSNHLRQRLTEWVNQKLISIGIQYVMVPYYLKHPRPTH